MDSGNVAICTLQNGCTNVLGDSSIFHITSAAIDSRGNVWAAYYRTGAGGIALIAWPHGGMPGKVVSGYIKSGNPGDILFDRHGTLLALETDDPVVYQFSCSLRRGRVHPRPGALR